MAVTGPEEGEVRDVPFLKNDMKESVPTMGKPVNTPDAPGKADSEIADEEHVGVVSA